MAEKGSYASDSLENLNNLQIRAKTFESKSRKGFMAERDIEREMEELRLSCLENADAMYDYTGDEFSGQMAEKFRKPMSFEPTEVALVLKDIVCDIAALYSRAFKLMLENMSHAHIVKVETSYENDIFERKWRSEQKAFEKQERRERRERKIREKDSSFVDLSHDRVKPRKARRGEASFETSSHSAERPSRPKMFRGSSNIVFIRNREFKPAKVFRPSFKRSKSESSFAEPCMAM